MKYSQRIETGGAAGGFRIRLKVFAAECAIKQSTADKQLYFSTILYNFVLVTFSTAEKHNTTNTPQLVPVNRRSRRSNVIVTGRPGPRGHQQILTSALVQLCLDHDFHGVAGEHCVLDHAERETRQQRQHGRQRYDQVVLDVAHDHVDYPVVGR
jgi:hypothetical protein